MEETLPKRKPTRCVRFDYDAAGIYFLTICTQNRQPVLSRVICKECAQNLVGGDVPDAPQKIDSHIELLPYGEIADKYIKQLNDFYDCIKVDQYVIMPNHIHLMLFVLKDGASRTSPPTGNGRPRQHSSVSRFVSTFKRFCNQKYGKNIWQRHFNDHVIRDRKDYEKHQKYIFENPLLWAFDELYYKE